MNSHESAAGSPPGPAGARSYDELSERLRALRAWSGVSYRELHRRVVRARKARGVVELPVYNTVYRCLQPGRTRLDADLVVDIASALLGEGSPAAEWRQSCRLIEHTAAAAAPAATRLRFGVLGPVEVRRDGRLVTIGHDRERVLLVALLLNADQLTPAEHVVGALWDEPPASAKAQLHNLIGTLRRRLRVEPDELFVCRFGGYELRLGGNGLDLAEFRRLVEKGRRASDENDHQSAAAAFAAALSLWRGPALADVDGAFAARARSSLQAERLDAEAEHNAALTQAGRRAPRQLPPAPRIMTGREKLVDDVCAELRQRDGVTGPVIVLIGPGGVGKTAVAVTAAHRVDGSFPDGQLYADLRGTKKDPVDAHSVLGRLLRALGVAGARVPDDGDERVAMYRTCLAQRRMLVLLDDAASEEQVRPLLPSAAGCAAVVTSRRQLGALLGATRWTVPVLAAPAALQLLATVISTERAAREQEAAAEIVGLCGHLPLAVCVAAARLAVHPEWALADFRRRLSEQRHRLDELAVGDLDVRASIALSYEVLTPPLRTLLRRLGLVSAPDWPAWVAQELVGQESEQLLERMLDQLVDIHLVESLSRDALGQSRFRLHDLVAEFARERVGSEDAPPQRAEAVSRVLSGWLALATDADEELQHGLMSAGGLPAPPAPRGAPRVRAAPDVWFDIERVNLVAAVDQACRAGNADVASGLALRLAGFLAVRSYDDDREHTLRLALTCTRADRRTLRLLGALFAVVAQRDRYAELPAIAAAELAVAGRLGDRQAEFLALTHAGRAARMRDRYAEAADWLERALAVSRQVEIAPALVSRALSFSADVQADLGRPAHALPLLEEAIALETSTGGDRRMAIVLRSYGVRLTDLVRHPDAERVLERALAAARKVDDDRGSAWIEHAQADLDIRAGRWRDAAARLNRSLRTQENVGDREGTAGVLRSMGDLASGEGEPRKAVEPLRRSLAIWRRLGARLEQARTLARLADALRDQDDPTAATACDRDCEAILTELELDDSSLLLPPRGEHAGRPPRRIEPR